jgi:hypothetical protein
LPAGSPTSQAAPLVRGNRAVEESDLFEYIQRTLPRNVLDRAGGEIDRRAVRICL